ncbi:hypothetical protein ACHAWT_004653 [Skeletonema menzelii]
MILVNLRMVKSLSYSTLASISVCLCAAIGITELLSLPPSTYFCGIPPGTPKTASLPII